ncbi:Txe/YoeB family addiction module toxin [Levilactobacillus fujinensis]|uniref:Endoribonuclease YoeB n=1 Tax=Levilactobacillus fujinensis TaxID=2486024 RepID=A0ABW1TH10_9LACO|nr:Txe/YoeB family addiction module toxin [Levilactobacillus fujinensis]
MNNNFSENVWTDYQWLLKNNKPSLKRVNNLLRDIARHPFTGIGKPEPLHGNYAGTWSRRVNHKDRLIYTIKDNDILIYICRTHYSQK